MNRIPVFLSVTVAVILFAILSPDATDDRLDGEHLLKAPSVSDLNTREYLESILQVTEKDILFLEYPGKIRDTYHRLHQAAIRRQHHTASLVRSRIRAADAKGSERLPVHHRCFSLCTRTVFHEDQNDKIHNQQETHYQLRLAVC